MEDTLYGEAKRLNIPMDNHESDLYLKVTHESQELIRKYDKNLTATIFKNQIDNTFWFDIPFAYLPFWENKPRWLIIKITNKENWENGQR